MRIAIIGTAGDGDDTRGLTAEVWRAMQADAQKQVAAEKHATGVSAANMTLVSGGEPYADHLAVRLWQSEVAGTLELHLPAPLAQTGFDRTSEAGDQIARRHQTFRDDLGVASVKELVTAANGGARVCSGADYGERNTAIAAAADAVIAYTFGPGSDVVVARIGEPEFGDPTAAGVKPGEAAETWRQAHRASWKMHVPLHVLARSVEAG
ncbi:MAG: hypothetical protein U5L06_09765 [Rhodovibrio sp.]|nr:hypothetical protein [Rhodovibrio sp.]